MTLRDYLKAAGLGALVLALDLLVAVGVVFAWSILVAPGHDQAWRQAAAPALSVWSTRIAGPLLFALFVWLFSRRRPERGAFAFAVAVWVAYVVLDGAVVAFRHFLTLPVILTLLLKLAGALAGAALAVRSAVPRASADGPR